MSERKFTEKQEKFIAAYRGNGTQAAREAGYSGDSNALGVQAHELLRNPKIVAAIRERQDHEIAPLVATRSKRQKFWTEIMDDQTRGLTERLRASELLGKSEADFTDKIQLEDKTALAEKIAKAKKRVAG